LQPNRNVAFRRVKRIPKKPGTGSLDRCHTLRFARHVAERVTTVERPRVVVAHE